MRGSFKEKDLEDYAMKHFIELLSVFSGSNEDYEILGSQVPCETGRIDILARSLTTLLVIELKAVEATEKTVGQVMRYAHLIKHVAENEITHRLLDVFEDGLSIWESDPHVMAIIVAPSFTENALRAMHYHGWSIIASPTEYGFAFAPSKAPILMPSSLPKILDPFTNRVVGGVIGTYQQQSLLTYNKAVSHVD